MEGLTSAMLSYFHPPQNFQATRGKRIWEKCGEREHGILLFLCKPLTHFILLPNLQGPGTTYSVMTRWGGEGAKPAERTAFSTHHSFQVRVTKIHPFQSFLPSCQLCLNGCWENGVTWNKHIFMVMLFTAAAEVQTYIYITPHSVWTHGQTSINELVLFCISFTFR